MAAGMTDEHLQKIVDDYKEKSALEDRSKKQLETR